MNTSTINLNNNQNKIRNWAIQWKVNFIPDPDKQVQEVIFQESFKRKSYRVYFKFLSQKHLGKYLDTKLNFQEHLNNVLSKVNKTIIIP